jgi:hypothetical protein
MPKYLELTRQEAQTFRDQLREARDKARDDSEAFEKVVVVVENLGCQLRKEQGGLGKYRPYIIGLASRSALFHAAPDASSELNTPFPALYDLVTEARNRKMHEGDFARIATRHAVELALVLEDALSPPNGRNNSERVADFMVRNPTCAALWHPLNFIRQAMLANSFSYLPVNTGTETKASWQLVSDKELVKYLRLRPDSLPLKTALVQRLEQATTGDGPKLVLIEAQTCSPSSLVKQILADAPAWDGRPVLVTRGNSHELLGILTPYDLL